MSYRRGRGGREDEHDWEEPYSKRHKGKGAAGAYPPHHAMTSNGMSPPGPEVENFDPAMAQGMPNSLRILVPEKSTKKVIGQSGENVRRIGSQAGCFIHVSSRAFNTRDACTDHIVSISPRNKQSSETWAHAIEQCSFAMKAVMREAFQSIGEGDPFKCIFLAPAHCAGLIIGNRGDRVGHIRRVFDVDIQLSKPPHGQFDEEVTFTGKLDQVEQVVNMMNDVFQVYWPNVSEDEQRMAQIEQARRDKEFERRGMAPGTGSSPTMGGKPGPRGMPPRPGGYGGPPPMGPSYGPPPTPGPHHGPSANGGAGMPPRSAPAPGQSPAQSPAIQHGLAPPVVAASQLTSVCDHIPITEQKTRALRLEIPESVTPEEILGRNGYFTRDIRAKVEQSKLGNLTDIAVEEDGVITVRATEGVLPYIAAQLMEKFRQAEG
ncbi:unnamed protein product [Amoebophrya sp. A25]|nr:unnamed protein product [Amoebophrya sp. A25]|eukprot:GSA25T00013677001.1